MEINNIGLLDQEVQEIRKLLLKSLHNPPQLEDLWKAMDEVWDKIGCTNKKVNCKENHKRIELFYKHPVWILNGLFIEQDELSMQHRQIISSWIDSNKSDISSVLDYGGGFGTLARLIAKKDGDLDVDIYEPHPTKLALEKLKAYSNVCFVSSLTKEYDCIVCTDVLEHVPDPLGLFAEMIQSVKVNKYLVIANCFYPVIKCHLPTTFHLRYTFNYFARLMGLQVLGSCKSSHATLYKKIVDKPFGWKRLRTLEKLSKVSYRLLRIVRDIYVGLMKVLG